MEHKLRVSSSPHIHRIRNTSIVMLDVIIALLPAGIMGMVWFGMRAGLVILIAVLAAVGSEFLYNKYAKKPQTVTDLSAVVTGLLVAYNLPASVPLWMPAVGSAIAIILVKMLFGGIGCNFVNPALAARAILMTSWVDHMSGAAFNLQVAGADAVSSATPLALTQMLELSSVRPDEFSFIELLLGQCPGCIGEVSRLAIIVGGVYLLIRRTISWHITFTMLGTFFVLSLVSSGSLWGNAMSAIYQLFSGGLMLGAWFMATDYTTSPATNRGRLLYGCCCGALVFVIRRFSSMPEGVSYAILFMNLFVPLIDRYVRPKAFGRARKHA